MTCVRRHRHPHFARDRRGGDRVVAGDQPDADLALGQRREQGGRFGARGVGQPEEAGQRQLAAGQVRDGVFVLGDQLGLLRGQPAPRDGDHPQPFGRQLTHGRGRCRARCPLQAASTTSGAPLTVSSSPNTDAENDLPDRNGRCAVQLSADRTRAVDRLRRLDDGAVGGVHLRAAVGVRCRVRRAAQDVVAGVARRRDAPATPAAGSRTACRSCRSTRRRCGPAPPPTAGPAPARRSWSAVGPTPPARGSPPAACLPAPRPR